MFRHRGRGSRNDGGENGNSDNEPDTGEGEGRKIFESKFYEKPGRAPDATEQKPDEERFHNSG